MPRCTICKRENEEVPLFEGVLKTDIVMICNECARSEGIPIIRKPSKDQLQRADERYSVRERMEKISGVRDATEISEEQTIVQGTLARLKAPPKKQSHLDVLDNYYWTLNMARRRKKLSIGQLAERVQIDRNIIQSIEKGRIPENFQEIFLKLESFLGIKLLRNHPKKLSFTRTVDEEKEILRSVEARMSGKDFNESDVLLSELESEEKNDFDDEYLEKKEETKRKISKGEADFSRRESFENVTLNDLVEMKKERERRQMKFKKKIETDAMIGDDLDIELDEL